jgi:hypothetical protein
MEARSGQQSTETPADNNYIHRVGERGTGEPGLDIRIVQIVFELAGDFDILRVAIAANALVALLAVFRAQLIRIEGQLQIGDKSLIIHCSYPPRLGWKSASYSRPYNRALLQ